MEKYLHYFACYTLDPGASVLRYAKPFGSEHLARIIFARSTCPVYSHSYNLRFAVPSATNPVPRLFYKLREGW